MASGPAQHPAVKEHYEAYPYPAEGWINFDPNRRGMINYHGGRGRNRPVPPDARILVAGCGTREAVQWALSFPEARVTGIDLSENSIRLTEGFARQLGVENLQTQALDILAVGSLEGGPFDLISSYGVLHHMKNPSAGLRELKGVLAEGGLMHLMVYNTSNRRWFQIIQSMVNDLCEDHQNVNERFEVAGRLVRDLAGSEDHSLQSIARDAVSLLDENPPHFMDTYAHPQECSYDVAGLMAWLDGAGLRFAGWINPWMWNIERVLRDPWLIERYATRPHAARDHLIDHTRQPLFEFYAEAADLPAWEDPHAEPGGEAFWNLVPLPLKFGGHEVVEGRLTGNKVLCRPQSQLLQPTEPGGAPVARVWVDERHDFASHPIILDLLEGVDGQRTMAQISRDVCQAKGIAPQDVREAMEKMWRGLLDEAHCIDVDPERCG